MNNKSYCIILLSHSTAVLNVGPYIPTARNDYREPETITQLGETLHYVCRPANVSTVGYMVKDERNISTEWQRVEVNNVTASDGGLYQCLSHWDWAPVRFFAYHYAIGYAIIPCKYTLYCMHEHVYLMQACQASLCMHNPSIATQRIKTICGLQI